MRVSSGILATYIRSVISPLLITLIYCNFQISYQSDLYQSFRDYSNIQCSFRQFGYLLCSQSLISLLFFNTNLSNISFSIHSSGSPSNLLYSVHWPLSMSHSLIPISDFIPFLSTNFLPFLTYTSSVNHPPPHLALLYPGPLSYFLPPFIQSRRTPLSRDTVDSTEPFFVSFLEVYISTRPPHLSSPDFTSTFDSVHH